MNIKFVLFLCVLSLTTCTQSVSDKEVDHCLEYSIQHNCTKCQANYYLDTNKNNSKCKPCHSKCLKCSGKEQDQCLSCPQNLLLKNNQCFSFPVLRSLNGFCKHEEKLYRCPIGCKSCNCSALQNQTCIQFLPGYTLGLQQNRIIKCQQACLSCQQILSENSTKVNKCLQCPPTYMLKDFRCQICPDRNCSKCTSIQNKVQCQMCIQGFYLKKKQNGETCQQCSQVFSNCMKCEQVQSTLQCLACTLGYYLATSQDNKTSSCQKCIQGCLRCQQRSRNACKQCVKGFVMINNTCLKCSEGCNECKIKQNGIEQCTNCVSGYKQMRKRLQNDTIVKFCIKQCHYLCLECTENNPKQCTSCYDGYMLAQQQKKCIPLNVMNQSVKIYKFNRCPYGFTMRNAIIDEEIQKNTNISQFSSDEENFQDEQQSNTTAQEQENQKQQSISEIISEIINNQNENYDLELEKIQKQVRGIMAKQDNKLRFLQSLEQQVSQSSSSNKKNNQKQIASLNIQNDHDFCSTPCSENCAECSQDSQNCLYCNPGYYAQNIEGKNKCIECPQKCHICNNKHFCQICSAGYTYKKNIFDCVKCQHPCKQCVENHPDVCLSCQDESLYQLSGWKCKLKYKVAIEIKINTEYFQFIGKDKTKNFNRLIISSINNLRKMSNRTQITDNLVSITALQQGSVVIKLQIQTSTTQQALDLSEDCQQILTKSYKNQFGQILSFKIEPKCGEQSCGQVFTNASESIVNERNDNKMLLIMFVIILAIGLIITGMIFLFQKLEKKQNNPSNLAQTSQKYVMQQDQLFSI